MKKREITLVLVLIVFGLLYYAFEKGDFRIFRGMSLSADRAELLSEKYFDYPENELVFTEIERISVENPAGELTVEKSPDQQVHIYSICRVFHDSREAADKIRQQVGIQAAPVGKELKITANSEDKFPFNRCRIHLKILVPDGMKIQASNRYGNVRIDGIDGDVSLQQRFGNVTIENLMAPVHLIHEYGNAVLKNISKNVILETKFADIEIEKCLSFHLVGKNGKYTLKDIAESTYIENKLGSVSLENCQAVEMDCKFTKINGKNLKGGINIRNTFEKIELESISGDTKIEGKNCRIRIDGCQSEAMTIENSFDSLTIKGFHGALLNVLQKHGNVEVGLVELTERLNIKGEHGNVVVGFAKTLSPRFNIHSQYGKIDNRSQIILDVVSEGVGQYANGGGEEPEIIVDSLYGDITLENY